MSGITERFSTSTVGSKCSLGNYGHYTRNRYGLRLINQTIGTVVNCTPVQLPELLVYWEGRAERWLGNHAC
jgi:hypothetical protein